MSLVRSSATSGGVATYECVRGECGRGECGRGGVGEGESFDVLVEDLSLFPSSSDGPS